MKKLILAASLAACSLMGGEAETNDTIRWFRIANRQGASIDPHAVTYNEYTEYHSTVRALVESSLHSVYDETLKPRLKNTLDIAIYIGVEFHTWARISWELWWTANNEKANRLRFAFLRNPDMTEICPAAKEVLTTQRFSSPEFRTALWDCAKESEVIVDREREKRASGEPKR